MYCHNCGAPRASANARFCPRCGTAYPATAAEVAPDAPTAALPPWQPRPEPPLAGPYRPVPGRSGRGLAITAGVSVTLALAFALAHAVPLTLADAGRQLRFLERGGQQRCRQDRDDRLQWGRRGQWFPARPRSGRHGRTRGARCAEHRRVCAGSVVTTGTVDGIDPARALALVRTTTPLNPAGQSRADRPGVPAVAAGAAPARRSRRDHAGSDAGRGHTRRRCVVGTARRRRHAAHAAGPAACLGRNSWRREKSAGRTPHGPVRTRPHPCRKGEDRRNSRRRPHLSLTTVGPVTTWDRSAKGVLALPSGRLVRGRGLRHGTPDGPAPQFGLYLQGKPPPAVGWPARWVRWPDWWLPADPADARAAMTEAWQRATRERVAVACSGGRGRAGTVLAWRSSMAFRPLLLSATSHAL